jgi:hypothetical protein
VTQSQAGFYYNKLMHSLIELLGIVTRFWVDERHPKRKQTTSSVAPDKYGGARYPKPPLVNPPSVDTIYPTPENDVLVNTNDGQRFREKR